MFIGTVRPEEAKVFDQDAGTHKVPAYPVSLEFEVSWSDGCDHTHGDCACGERPGWYWNAGWGSGGPFASSTKAKDDCEEELEERAQDDAEERAARR